MPDHVRYDEQKLDSILNYDTASQAGVYRKVVWIPAYAGMTNRDCATLDKIFLTIFLGHTSIRV
jgi:hypothetical protein